MEGKRQIQSWSQPSLVRRNNSAERHGILLLPGTPVLPAPHCQRDMPLLPKPCRLQVFWACQRSIFPGLCMSVGARISHGGRGLLSLPWASPPQPESCGKRRAGDISLLQPWRGRPWDTGPHLGVLLQVPLQWDAQGSHLAEVDHPAPVLPNVVDQHHPTPAARQGSHHSTGCPCNSCCHTAKMKSTGATGARSRPSMAGPS